MIRLIVETPDQKRHAFDSGEIRFGRQPDLELPLSDPSTLRPIATMKRQVGTFLFAGDSWSVRNDAEESETGRFLHVVGASDRSRITVYPRTATRLGRGGAVVIDGEYTLRFSVPGALAEPPRQPPSSDVPTTRFPVQLTPRMVDFLITLAEPELRGQPPGLRRTQGEVAELWGVKLTTVQETLEDARNRFRQARLLLDVDPDRRQRARNQTEAMIHVALQRGVLTYDDLVWAALAGPEGPVSAASGPRFHPGGGG